MKASKYPPSPSRVETQAAANPATSSPAEDFLSFLPLGLRARLETQVFAAVRRPHCRGGQGARRGTRRHPRGSGPVRGAKSRSLHSLPRVAGLAPSVTPGSDTPSPVWSRHGHPSPCVPRPQHPGVRPQSQLPTPRGTESPGTQARRAACAAMTASRRSAPRSAALLLLRARLPRASVCPLARSPRE